MCCKARDDCRRALSSAPRRGRERLSLAPLSPFTGFTLGLAPGHGVTPFTLPLFEPFTSLALREAVEEWEDFRLSLPSVRRCATRFFLAGFPLLPPLCSESDTAPCFCTDRTVCEVMTVSSVGVIFFTFFSTRTTDGGLVLGGGAVLVGVGDVVPDAAAAEAAARCLRWA